MLWLPSYKALRRVIRKRIALLSACWGQRFSFLKISRKEGQEDKNTLRLGVLFAPLRETSFCFYT